MTMTFEESQKLLEPKPRKTSYIPRSFYPYVHRDKATHYQTVHIQEMHLNLNTAILNVNV